MSFRMLTFSSTRSMSVVFYSLHPEVKVVELQEVKCTKLCPPPKPSPQVLLTLKLVHMWQKAVAPHSSTLAWEIPWTEEPGRLQSMGSRRVGHNWATSLSLFTFMHWRRKWQPTPVFLPGESQGQEPGGLPSMGLHRVGYNWRDLAAAAVHMLPLAIHQSHFKCSYEYWLQNQAFAWGKALGKQKVIQFLVLNSLSNF